MPYEDNSSQIPAVVRSLRNSKGKTWNDKVKAWQREYNIRNPSMKLKVDGLAGPKTRAAMARATGQHISDFSRTGQPDTGRYMTKSEKRSKKGIARQVSKNMRIDLNTLSERRRYLANRNINYLKPGSREWGATVHERYRAEGKEYAKRLGEQARKRKRGIKQLVNTPSDPYARDRTGFSTAQPRKYKTLAATLKNLDPTERAEFIRKYTNYAADRAAGRA